MRQLIGLALVLFTLFLGFSCDTKTKPQSEQRQQRQEEFQVDSPIDPEWRSVRRYPYLQKEEALAEAGQAVASLQTKIRNIESRVGVAGADVSHDLKESWKEDAENLRRQRDLLLERFERLERATPESWEQAQEDFIEDWEKLRDRWESVRLE